MAQQISACLPPMRPGLDSCAQHLLWVEFVVGALPVLRVFFMALDIKQLTRPPPGSGDWAPTPYTDIK